MLRPPTRRCAATARVEADEAARLRGDSAAWARVAPGFLFVHSTGAVDDLAAFQRFRAAGAAGTARLDASPRRPVAPPVDRLEGDVFVRVRLLGDSVGSAAHPGQSRVTDVYVRRGAEWYWLAHQTAEVSPRWSPAAPEPAALGEYAGTYAAPDGRRRVYAVRGDSLVQVLGGVAAAPGAAAPVRRLLPIGRASFGYDGLSATVTFVRDRTGRVAAAAESSQVGFVEYARVTP